MEAEYDCSGLPSARPAAAIPTVLDATSYKHLAYEFQMYEAPCKKSIGKVTEPCVAER
jgi:hypothetical protein